MGMSAYNILNDYPKCPIRLPHARSMTQAKIDFEFREDDILKWYMNNILNLSEIEKEACLLQLEKLNASK